ncbi:hypothetical protein IK146_00255 [Candidatus Saccharibacteria bacterium]|nr:hypothetical protein [Candidatus Saccharibacteria bacterium]
MSNMFNMYGIGSANVLTDISAIADWDVGSVTAAIGSTSSGENKFYQMFRSVRSSAYASFYFVNRPGSVNSLGTYVPTAPHNLGLTLGTGVANITVDGRSYSDSDTVVLGENSTYTINMTFASGYEFDSWSISGTGASVASTSTQSTTFTMGSSDATLTARAKEVTFDSAFASAGKTKQGGYYTMQDMSASICSAVAGNQTGTLVDTRDGSTYTVAKLVNNDITPAYSECWMTQNMRLDFSSPTLTSQSVADLESATNNPASGFWTVAQGATASSSGFDLNNYDVVKYSKINIGDNTTDSTDHTYDEYGIYYNWYTATAGHGTQSKSSGNTDGDLCPSGWHLPTGSAEGEFGELNNAINNGSSSSPSGLLASPASYLLSGFFIDASANGRGSYASYWSSTADGYGIAYDLYFGGSYVYPGTDSDNKYGGQAVRCIADNTPAEPNQQSNEPEATPESQEPSQQNSEPQSAPQQSYQSSYSTPMQAQTMSQQTNSEETAEDETKGDSSEETNTQPLGVRKLIDETVDTTANISNPDGSGIFGTIAIVSAGIAATTGLLLLAGKKREEDEEES